jgi:hypothetical protein
MRRVSTSRVVYIYVYIKTSRLFSSAVLQACFRRRTSFTLCLTLTLPCESPLGWPSPPPTFLPDIILRLQITTSIAKIARNTLPYAKRVTVDHEGRCSTHAVSEYQELASPRMRVRHFNIAGVAWSNFKPGVNTNGRIAILNATPSINVVNVGAGVDEALVAL